MEPSLHYYIAQSHSVSSNFIGARWTFYNMASPVTHLRLIFMYIHFGHIG